MKKTIDPFIALSAFALLSSVATGGVALADDDTDGDGLPDAADSCPVLAYSARFDFNECAPLNGDPVDDCRPECKARERVVDVLLNSGRFATEIAFAVVEDGRVHFADAFTYVGQGEYVHNPEGVRRLYRVGSTSKPIAVVAAMAMHEAGWLSMDDFVNDADGTQQLEGGRRTLRQLLGHRGAFKLDVGAIHLYCYPGDLGAFWLEPNDLISPRYDSATYGNLGGGYQYSAFNYSLAGAYLANRAEIGFGDAVQRFVFDRAGMCTATYDGGRAVGAAIGDTIGFSQGGSMHVGPYINLVSPSDPLCEDNFYSTNDVYGEDDYSWQPYRLDEADAEARDPPGGVIASVLDLAHFAESLLASYRGEGGPLSPDGVRELWAAWSDLGCAPSCPYQAYYATGFFTDSLPGQPVNEIEHGGSRPGFASGFVMRPEDGRAVCILVNADVSTVLLSDVAKAILNDFEAAEDDCEPRCQTDWDDNGVVNAADVGAFLSAYFADLLKGTLVADFDGNGVTNAADVGAFLSVYFPESGDPACNGG